MTAVPSGASDGAQNASEHANSTPSRTSAAAIKAPGIEAVDAEDPSKKARQIAMSWTGELNDGGTGERGMYDATAVSNTH